MKVFSALGFKLCFLNPFNLPSLNLIGQNFDNAWEILRKNSANGFGLTNSYRFGISCRIQVRIKHLKAFSTFSSEGLISSGATKVTSRNRIEKLANTSGIIGNPTSGAKKYGLAMPMLKKYFLDHSLIVKTSN